MRGYFLWFKADDEGMLPYFEEDNAAAQKIDRKGGTVLKLADYTYQRGRDSLSVAEFPLAGIIRASLVSVYVSKPVCDTL